MNTTVWKFEIHPLCMVTELEMPKGARFLTVETQENTNRPMIWALVDPGAEKETCQFLALRTGISLPSAPGFENPFYRGTCQVNHGKDIVHIFELRPPL